MTTCLRSGAHLARASRQAVSRSRFTSPSPAVRSISSNSSRGVRRYSTQQDPQEEDKGTNKGSGKKSAAGKPKAAPGTEHLYNNQGPLSKGSTSGRSTNTHEPPPSKLTAEEEETLQNVVNLISKGMPKTQREDLKKVHQLLRRDGIPDELKDVMQRFRETGSFDLSTAARVVRIVSSLARKAILDSEMNENQQQYQKQDEPQQKAGAHNPNPENKEEEKKHKKRTGQGQGFFDPKGQGSPLKLDLGTLFTSVLVSYLLYSTLSPGERSKDITWQEFRNQFLDRGLVEKLTVINNHKVRVHLNREAVKSVYPDSPAGSPSFYYYFSIGDINSFENHLDKAHEELGVPSNQRIPVAYAEENPWSTYIISFGPTLLLIGMGYWILRRSAGSGGGSSGIFSMGKSRAKRFNHEADIKVTFKDVAGMDEAKQEITEFVSFLKEPGMYQKLGAKIPRGAILSGPPGTGKTLLAKATAGESAVPFFSVSGSEFVEMFVGVGASRVRDLFATARKNTPCIIFIDEIDAIGKSRGKNQFNGGNDEREATLNQILTEMDGFNTTEQVVVLAGTNRSDVLDKALMRPGRFDRHIHIDKPTMDGRKQIFAVHLSKVVTKEDLSYLEGRLAALTPGFSGADIANCVNEAALIAARVKADGVTMQHFEQAIERVIGGLEKKSLVLSPEEKKVVAYHEAGHAICGWFFQFADPLLKVSIIPRGQGALGYAQYLPQGDTYLMNVNQLMDRMAMTLGGRVSEELHFDTVTSGASDDFSKVTRMATAMVTKWGMSSKIGYMYYEDDAQQQLHKPFSEETAKNIDSEVRRIVDEAYQQCRDLLEEKKKEVGLVAEELLSKEVLARDDLIRILGPRPFEDKGDFSKYFGAKGDREGVPGSTPQPREDEGGASGGNGGGTPAGGPLGPTPTPTIFRQLGKEGHN